MKKRTVKEPTVMLPANFDAEMSAMISPKSRRVTLTNEQLQCVKKWATVYQFTRDNISGVTLNQFTAWFKKKYGFGCHTYIRNTAIDEGWMSGRPTNRGDNYVKA